jgi:sarcosine oxidase subunit beta
VTVNVVVVGAGIIGLAIARAAAGRGHSVVVLERERVAAGASGIQPGGVRQQWGTAVACRLARESVRFWREAGDLLASPVPLELRRSGYLFVAQGEETVARLAANVRVQNAEGVPSRIVSPEEAARLVPGLRADELAGGAWCDEDGYFDRPQSVVEAFAAGLDVRIHTVESLTNARDGWLVGCADGVRLTADHVVVAAGTETVRLLEPLGVTLPIEPEERYLFLSEPVSERLLEPLVVSPELAFAAKQLAGGRVLASDLAARGASDDDREEWRAHVRAAVERLLPRLTYISYPLLVRGVYDVTPDRQPVLGPVAPGLHVAAGFSGHGFMIAPAVARIVVDALAGERDDVLDVLGADRFATGRLVPEPQLV